MRGSRIPRTAPVVVESHSIFRLLGEDENFGWEMANPRLETENTGEILLANGDGTAVRSVYAFAIL